MTRSGDWRLVFLAAALLVTPSRAADAPAAPGIHYVYLIRHGLYDRDSTVTDDVTGHGINALGRVQARRIGERLAALPVRPASLVSSTLRRARETAEVMSGPMKMAVMQDSLISECTPLGDGPAPAGESPAAIALCDSTLARAWAKYLTPAPGGGDRHDVLVCHGNVIRWFVARTVGADPRGWRRMDIGHGSLTVLAVRPDGSARLVMFSDVGHLPLAEQTWAGRGAGWSTPAR